MRASRMYLIVTLLALSLVPAATAEAAPQLLRFAATDRIATGKVARYDLREEATAFSYRIRAQYVEATVQRLREGKWRRVGAVRAAPPRPLNFWRVFRTIGLGTYRIVARAHNGTGTERERSAAKTIRFRVVRHIAHSD